MDSDADYTVKEWTDENSWKEVPSALVKNFNYAKVIDAAPYNLMIDVEIGGMSARSYLINKNSKDHTSQTFYHHALSMDTRTTRNLRFAKTANDSSIGDLVVKNGKMDIHFSR